MLNPLSNDAFEMVALTAAINKIPNNYGRVEQLGLMPSEGVRTRTILIEEMSGVLNLLPTQPVGAPGDRCVRVPGEDGRAVSLQGLEVAAVDGVVAFGLDEVEERIRMDGSCVFDGRSVNAGSNRNSVNRRHSSSRDGNAGGRGRFASKRSPPDPIQRDSSESSG